jgi:hypothetical protein
MNSMVAMPIIKLVSFGPIKRGDWVVKVSYALDHVLVIAYHLTNYSCEVRSFVNEYEAVMFVEYLITGDSTM